MVNPRPHWNFDDPADSQLRFQRLADQAPATEGSLWRTQVARALGLQGRFDEGHAVLDQLAENPTNPPDPATPPGLKSRLDPELTTRIHLERGRLVRSAGEPDLARPHIERAVESARTAQLVDLELDAWHMLALVADPRESIEIHHRAIELARSISAEQTPTEQTLAEQTLAEQTPAEHTIAIQARSWEASMLHNLALIYADNRDYATALPLFEQARSVRQDLGDPDTIRVATWMVARTLRQLGRREEAIVLQRQLKAEAEASGADPTHIDAELRELDS